MRAPTVLLGVTVATLATAGCGGSDKLNSGPTGGRYPQQIDFGRIADRHSVYVYVTTGDTEVAFRARVRPNGSRKRVSVSAYTPPLNGSPNNLMGVGHCFRVILPTGVSSAQIDFPARSEQRRDLAAFVLRRVKRGLVHCPRLRASRGS